MVSRMDQAKAKGRARRGRPGLRDGRALACGFDEGLEVLRAAALAQPAQGLGLDLSDALARDRKDSADLFERVVTFLSDAEA